MDHDQAGGRFVPVLPASRRESAASATYPPAPLEILEGRKLAKGDSKWLTLTSAATRTG